MTLYDILGVKKKSTDSEIRKAYRKLAVKYHPDRNKDNPDAEEKFKEITKAYEILGDLDKRQYYDNIGKKLKGTDLESVFEMLNSMFERQNSIPKVVATVEMTTRELYSEQEKTIIIKRWEQCKKCDGNGTKDCEEHLCKKCDGHGEIMKGATVDGNNGNADFKTKLCKKCKGRGIDPSVKLCKKCNGDRCMEVEYKLKVTVPAGAYGGYVVTVKNKGNYIPKDERLNPKKTKTDVDIHIKEMEDELFMRGFILENATKSSPADLAYDITVTFSEALCGFKKEIEHLSGECFDIVNKKQVMIGDYLVYKGKGMPVVDTDLYGNLFIRINMDPPKLSYGDRMKIWQILEGTPYPYVAKVAQTESLVRYDEYENENENENEK